MLLLKILNRDTEMTIKILTKIRRLSMRLMQQAQY